MKKSKQEPLDVGSIFSEKSDGGSGAPSAGASSGASQPSPSSSQKGSLAAKILAVLCAVVIWVYASSVDTTTTTKNFSNLAVTNKYAAELVENYNISVISGNDALVDITVEGKKNTINKLTEDDIVTYVDLSGITEAGEYTLKVNVNVPNGVNVSVCSPSSVTVFVDEEVSESKPVKTSTTFVKSDSDYMVDERIETPTVMVTGPKSVVDSVSCALLNIDLGTLSSSVDVVSRITLVDNYGNEVVNPYLRTNVSEVNVHYSVEMYKTVRLTTDLRNGTLGSDAVDVRLSADEILVKGSVEDLATLDEYTFYTLDEELLYNDVFSSNVRLVLPEGIENASDISDITVTARVREGSVRRLPVYLDAQSLADCNIRVIAPGDMRYSFTDTYFTVSVRGNSKDFEKLSKEEIVSSLNLTIDMSDLSSPGPTVVPVTAAPSANIGYYVVYSTDKKDDCSVDVRLSK